MLIKRQIVYTIASIFSHYSGLLGNNFSRCRSTLIGNGRFNMEKINRVNQYTNHPIGHNIKKLQRNKGLRNRDIITQLQLKGIDISHSTYSKIELGINIVYDGE